MALKFFNTLSRTLQDFVPLDPAGQTVGMYCCGPTVYDFAHIGNWRTFVFGDLVRRSLEFTGYEVQHVMNITDVEDKIIRRVRETNTTLREFTGQYEAAFFEDLKALNCLSAAHNAARHGAHPGDHRPDCETHRARHRLPGAGWLGLFQHREVSRIRAPLRPAGEAEFRRDARRRTRAQRRIRKGIGRRLRAVEERACRRTAACFWPSPWGEGRPGWHIECSAMSMKLLGTSFDLHLGGEDLMFPHHEDEIAQSEGAARKRGKPFVKYWLHGAHLLVEGKKMSKSLGNFFTLRDLLAKGFTGREIRYLLLTAHYRETFNFTLDGLQGARAALLRIDECVGKLRELAARRLPASPIRNQIAAVLARRWRTI